MLYLKRKGRKQIILYISLKPYITPAACKSSYFFFFFGIVFVYTFSDKKNPWILNIKGGLW